MTIWLIGIVFGILSIPSINAYYKNKLDSYWYYEEVKWLGNMPLPIALFIGIAFWPLSIIAYGSYKLGKLLRLHYLPGIVINVLSYPGKKLGQPKTIRSAKDQFLLEAERDVEAILMSEQEK
jgi:hypothetical protein